MNTIRQVYLANDREIRVEFADAAPERLVLTGAGMRRLREFLEAAGHGSVVEIDFDEESGEMVEPDLTGLEIAWPLA